MNNNSASTSPKEQELIEQIKIKRKAGLNRFRKLSLIAIGSGVISIGVGIGSLIAFASEGKVPYVIPVGVVAGIFTLFWAVFALRGAIEAQKFDQKTDVFKLPKRTLAKIIASFVFIVLGINACAWCIFGGGAGVILCVRNHEYCEKNHDAKLALSVLTLLFSLLVFVFSILGSSLFCCYGSSFGFENKRGNGFKLRLLEIKVHEQEKQLRRQQEYLDGMGTRY